MAKIIDGQVLAEKIKDKVAEEIYKLGGYRPNLAIILIGEREDSLLYVNLKEKEAKKIGIDTHIYKCPVDIAEREVLAMIDYLNNDDSIDAILVQLPLAEKFHADNIIKAIDPDKDVDRFHPNNLKVLLNTCHHQHVMPPVFEVILKILENINCQLKNRQICIMYNSEIFGKSLAKVLDCQQARVEIVKADSKDLIDKAKRADILITAIGRAKFVKKNMIKKDAIIIDIGITKKGKKVFGDVDFKDVKEKASYITPVPGGVGPMTIAMLFKNTLELYKQRRKL